MITGTWFKIGNNWYIDIRQVREIGAPYDDNNKCIEITFNDGKEVRYSVEDAKETLKRFAEIAIPPSIELTGTHDDFILLKGENYVV